MMSWRGFCKEGKHIWTAGAWRRAGNYSSSAFQDHYQVLGIGKEASKGEIKNAFITLSKKCHPDCDPSNPYLHAKFVRINEAYNILSKPTTRRQYDEILETIQRNRPHYKNPSQPYQKASRAQSTAYTHRKKEEEDNWSSENTRYWSQFPLQWDYDESEHERQQRANKIVFRCIFGVFLTIFLHLFIFSSIKDQRDKQMDKEQQRIIDFYNKTRDAAQTNGDQNQLKIILQKHEEKLRRLYGREDNTKK